jgi:hypothetical protein
LKNAGPISQDRIYIRQEAKWGLQWLAKQWEYSDDDDKSRPSERLPEVPTCVRKVQAEISELADARLDKVTAALGDRDIAVRLAAVDALVNLHAAGQDVIDQVFEMFNDPCQQVRLEAERTVNHMVLKTSGAPPEFYGP